MIRQLYNLYFSPEKDLAQKIRQIAGFTPRRLSLYKLAFLHKSLSAENNDFKGNNERLEFLGDAILSTIVADYLFKKYPMNDEGFMTKMRSKIVKRKTLNEIADKMGLDLILKDYSSGRVSSSMLGNALEALIGAIYLDSNYRKTNDYVINTIIRKYIDVHFLEERDDNFKSQLLEWCQKNSKVVDFQMMEQSKFDKRDQFRIAVMVDGIQLGTAIDFNKKSAEQLASKHAIQKLGFNEKISAVSQVSE